MVSMALGVALFYLFGVKGMGGVARQAVAADGHHINTPAPAAAPLANTDRYFRICMPQIRQGDPFREIVRRAFPNSLGMVTIGNGRTLVGSQTKTAAIKRFCRRMADLAEIDMRRPDPDGGKRSLIWLLRANTSDESANARRDRALFQELFKAVLKAEKDDPALPAWFASRAKVVLAPSSFPLFNDFQTKPWRAYEGIVAFASLPNHGRADLDLNICGFTTPPGDRYGGAVGRPTKVPSENSATSLRTVFVAAHGSVIPSLAMSPDEALKAVHEQRAEVSSCEEFIK